MYRSAFEKEPVDALRLFERFAERMARRRIKLQRSVAIVQVEIDKHDPALLFLSQIPGRVSCDRGGSDAAADADHEDELAGALTRRMFAPVVQNAVAGCFNRVDDQRLEEIFAHTGVF